VRRGAAGDASGYHFTKKQQVDWEALPFQALRSLRLSLRIPDITRRVREVELLDFQTVGSHTLFMGRKCSEALPHAGPQLCQTCGVQQRPRSRLERPFQEARQKYLDVTARSEGAKGP
jgi:hypothetical protein